MYDKREMKMLSTQTKGFTLIELLVVISIIALLSSVILGALQGARQKGTFAATRTFEINLKSALYDSGPNAIQDFYSFNSASGNTVPDEIGGNTLILNPSTCSTASSLNTTDTPDGSAQSLSITYNSCAQFTNPITPGNAFTISFWIKTTQNISAIFSNRGGNGNFSATVYYTVPDVYINNSTNSLSGTAHFSAHNIVSDGQWHLITYSFLSTTPGNGSWSVYFDGKIDTKGTLTYNGSTLFTQSTATYLGHDPNLPWNFNGLLDDFAIYDQAISDNQAYEIYALEAPAHGIALNSK